MKKKPNEKLKEFSKILIKIGEDIKPSAAFKKDLKSRLLAKLESNEPKQTFWQRVIKPLVLKPSFQVVFASLLIIFVVTTLLVRDFSVSHQNKYKEESTKQFSSIEEYEQYLLSSSYRTYGYVGSYGEADGFEYSISDPLLKMKKADRSSDTNVQVKGIDEGDILKTDGRNIYLSDSRTKIVKAFPPKSLSVLGKIDKSGDLLLQDNTLVIFSEKAIYGFDVSNANQPQQRWRIKIEEGTRVTDTRMKDGKIYFVANTSISPAKAVNRFLKVDGKPIDVAYGDIYYPGITINADSTYTVSALNPNTGNIEDKISFVGSSNDSVVYMSNNSIYLTYSYTEETIDEMADFLEQEAKNLAPNELTEAIKRLASYDLSARTKEIEMSTIFETYTSDNKTGERISKLITKFYKEKSREIEKTGIVKIGIPSLDIQASGKVAGHPLNQFALDEYQGNLRIATTVGEQFYGLSWLASEEPKSANDIYVLDKNLETKGSVKNLGLTERIYSARFINDKAYVVTFRETDPFYVLDLSNPSKPSLKGELKIPGYSSYLQPITGDKVLGVGKESQRVKIQLFDVSSPSNPKVLSKLVLDEYWSEALTNHHAFLLDDKYEVFFVPGEKAGYVVTYKNNKLSFKKAIAGISAKRALYLNDYLYIVGDKKITVIDENTWKEVSQLDIR